MVGLDGGVLVGLISNRDRKANLDAYKGIENNPALEQQLLSSPNGKFLFEDTRYKAKLSEFGGDTSAEVGFRVVEPEINRLLQRKVSLGQIPAQAPRYVAIVPQGDDKENLVIDIPKDTFDKFNSQITSAQLPRQPGETRFAYRQRVQKPTFTVQDILSEQGITKPQGSRKDALQGALKEGLDLRPFYGETYSEAVRFKKDLGQYAGKDVSTIIPPNPVGYSGGFKFDPNFGSAAYRDLAMQAGKALGLDEQTIFKKGTEFFADKFASGAQTKGTIGFKDFGGDLLDTLATTAGVPAERLGELRGTALKPLYDANQQLFSSLRSGAAIESDSSGFFKGIGQAFAGLGPIGTIALGAALGPAGLGLGAATAGAAAGALPGLLQGDLSSALKGGAIGGIGGGALKGLEGLGNSISNSVGGGAVGSIASNAATGAIKGGIGSLLTGGDLGQGLLGGALTGGVNAGVNAGANALVGQTGSFLDRLRRENAPLGTGISQGAGGQGLNLGDPNNFGSQFNLPNTTGYLNFMNGIGGLFDDVEFPGMGLNPSATGLLNFGSGLGQGLSIPKSPTLSGQLGQGLTVGVPGGTLGQGGITPTGQITLGNPNSFINGGQGSSSGFDASRLIRGLLGAGTAAAIGNALAGSSNNQQQAPSNLPVDRYSLNEQRFNYGGDINKYGTTDTGDFQFYKSNIGLLG